MNIISITKVIFYWINFFFHAFSFVLWLVNQNYKQIDKFDESKQKTEMLKKFFEGEGVLGSGHSNEDEIITKEKKIKKPEDLEERFTTFLSTDKPIYK